jgi:glutathione S-transferase
MIIATTGGYYPSHYGSTPFNGISNNYSIPAPSIPPYYNNPTFQQQQQPQHRLINQQNNENISSFKLYDIDKNSHSEIIRLIFSYADVSYKDKRLKEDEWNKIKDQMSFEQLPILRINNQYKIYHMHAIIRHLAREFHLYGTGKHDHAIVDIIIETTRQLQEKIFEQLKNSTDHEQTLRQIITDDSTIYLKQLENFYEIFNRHGPFYLGSHISLADLIVYDTINYLIKIDKNLLENYSHLKEARRRLEKHPRILNYINTKTNNQIKKSPKIRRHKTKSPTPNITSDHHNHHRHRSHEGHKSSHHHHHHCHHHHRRHSKEPTPFSQTKQRSVRSSKSPSITKKDKEPTPLQTTDALPPRPGINEEKCQSVVN